MCKHIFKIITWAIHNEIINRKNKFGYEKFQNKPWNVSYDNLY